MATRSGRARTGETTPRSMRASPAPSPRPSQRADEIVSRVRSLGVRVVTVEEPAYPSRLASIAMPPHVLFVTGDPAALSRERAVAIVGTRRATTAGRTTAGRIATALVAADATIVSGLAFGIDGVAHEATVRAGGTTVAVIGGGHAVVAPRSHARLAAAIIAGGGAVVSELAPDVKPSHGTFPRRNRIISGLSDATVVVEAPARSGALITASWALEQGRPCYLVPGALDAPASAGCLAFLREWEHEAHIVAGIPQLIADLGFARPIAGMRDAVAAATTQSLGAVEGAIAAPAGRRPRHRRRAGGGHRPAGRDRPHRARPARAPGPRRGDPRSLSPGRSAARRARRRSGHDERVAHGGVARPAGSVLPSVTRHAPTRRSGRADVSPPLPTDPVRESVLRKLIIAILAVPVLAAIYAATALRRSGIVRATVALGLGAALGLGVVAFVRPTLTTATPPTDIVPLTAGRIPDLGRHRRRAPGAGGRRILDADGARVRRGGAGRRARRPPSSCAGTTTTPP